MAGYGYPGRGYTTSYNGVEPRSDQAYWTSKTSYGADGISGSDHVCRPVIIDAEGRKHPIVSYNSGPNESYAAKSETIIEHVQIPMATEYRYSASTNYPPKEYGYGNNKWGSKAPPPSSVYDHQRPQKVEEFIGEIQNEVSRPTPTAKTGTILGNSNWRQNPSSTGYNGGYGGTNGGYNNDYDYSNKDWSKQQQQPSSYPNYSGNYRRDDIEPPMVAAGGGLARPSTRPAWGGSSYDSGGGGAAAALSKPTSDIGAAVEYLKEVAGGGAAATTTKPLSSGTTTGFPQPRFTVTVPRRENYGAGTTTTDSRLKRDAYTDTIDSREAARRYGNNGSVNGSNRPFVAVDPYAPTIDSREASRKYGGSTV